MGRRALLESSSAVLGAEVDDAVVVVHRGKWFWPALMTGAALGVIASSLVDGVLKYLVIGAAAGLTIPLVQLPRIVARSGRRLTVLSMSKFAGRAEAVLGDIHPAQVTISSSLLAGDVRINGTRHIAAARSVARLQTMLDAAG